MWFITSVTECQPNAAVNIMSLTSSLGPIFDGSAVIVSWSVSIGVSISVGGAGSVKFRTGGVGLGSSAGGGALAVFTGAECVDFVPTTEAGAADGTEATADEEEVMAPVSRSTSLG